MASWPETEAINFLRLVDELQLPASDRQPHAQLLIEIRNRGGIIRPSVFQQANGHLNCGDSLIRVSGRIIGPFHKTVKIWSSRLDIQPGAQQIFVKVRMIGYNPRDFARDADLARDLIDS